MKSHYEQGGYPYFSYISTFHLNKKLPIKLFPYIFEKENHGMNDFFSFVIW